MGKPLNVAIIGCGFIGKKRAKSLGSHRLILVADTDLQRAEALAAEHGNGVRAVTNWRDVVTNPSVDAVIIATTPDVMPTITVESLNLGKHVLVDKPAGRNWRELLHAVEIARVTKSIVRVGFNHRFHPALKKAHELVTSGAVGELMYVRARYGHGGRLGYEREWRAQRDISGGGELIDQGTHLIDLSRWFMGEFETTVGHAGTYFWDMSVDDNAFALLRTKDNKVAWLHVSWTEWKNLFCFEVFGKTGKLQIDGLGGSYGTETLTYYKMKPELGPPDVERWEFNGDDKSWDEEFEEFVKDIERGKETGPNLTDAVEALRIASAIYNGSTVGAGFGK